MVHGRGWPRREMYISGVCMVRLALSSLAGGRMDSAARAASNKYTIVGCCVLRQVQQAGRRSGGASRRRREPGEGSGRRQRVRAHYGSREARLGRPIRSFGGATGCSIQLETFRLSLGTLSKKACLLPLGSLLLLVLVLAPPLPLGPHPGQQTASQHPRRVHHNHSALPPIVCPSPELLPTRRIVRQARSWVQFCV